MVVATGVGDGGVLHGELLMRFGEAVLRSYGDRVKKSGKSCWMVSVPGLVDAAGVAGLFNAIDRVADATGTPLED